MIESCVYHEGCNHLEEKIQIEKKNAELEKLIKEREKTMKLLREQIAETNNPDALNDELIKQNEKLEVECQTLHEKVKEYEISINEHMRENIKLKSDLKEVKQMHEGLKTEWEINQSLIENQKKLDILTNKIKTKSKELQQIESKYEAIKTKINKDVSDANVKRQEYNSYVAKISIKHDQLNQLILKKAKLTNEIYALKGQKKAINTYRFIKNTFIGLRPKRMLKLKKGDISNE